MSTSPVASTSTVRTTTFLLPWLRPETFRAIATLPHPDKLGIVKRVWPQASVESSAKILAPSSLITAFPDAVAHVTQSDSGGTPALGLQFMSSYQTWRRSLLG